MIIMWAIADMLNFKKDPKQHLLCDFFMRCWFLQPCNILSFFFFQLNLLLIVIDSVRSSSLSHTGILVQSHFI